MPQSTPTPCAQKMHQPGKLWVHLDFVFCTLRTVPNLKGDPKYSERGPKGDLILKGTQRGPKGDQKGDPKLELFKKLKRDNMLKFSRN